MDRAERLRLFRDVERHFHAKRFDEAEAVLNRLIEAFPDDPDILCEQARCLAERGRVPEALGLCDFLIRRHGHDKARQLKARLESPAEERIGAARSGEEQPAEPKGILRDVVVAAAAVLVAALPITFAYGYATSENGLADLALPFHGGTGRDEANGAFLYFFYCMLSLAAWAGLAIVTAVPFWRMGLFRRRVASNHWKLAAVNLPAAPLVLVLAGLPWGAPLALAVNPLIVWRAYRLRLPDLVAYIAYQVITYIVVFVAGGAIVVWFFW